MLFLHILYIVCEDVTTNLYTSYNWRSCKYVCVFNNGMKPIYINWLSYQFMPFYRVIIKFEMYETHFIIHILPIKYINLIDCK